MVTWAPRLPKDWTGLRRREVQGDSSVFGLSPWNAGAAITGDEEGGSCGGRSGLPCQACRAGEAHSVAAVM